MKVFRPICLLLLLTLGCLAANYNGTYALYGSINNKYDIQMEISIDGQNVYGNYRYMTQDARLSLNGTINSNGFVTLYETDPNGNRTGVFRGTVAAPDGLLIMNGNWSTPDGRTTYVFSCSEPGC